MKLVGLLCCYAALVVWFLVDLFMPEPSAHTASVVGNDQPRVSRQALNISPLESGRSAEYGVAPASSVRAKAPIVPSQRNTAPDQPERRLEDMAVVLEEKFRSDGPATRESHERQRTIEGLFQAAELGEKGELSGLACKGSICRGEISIASASEDNTVFNRTFLSREFALGVTGAFSVPERRTLEDGRIIATFFIHPEEAIVGVPEGEDE